MEALVETRSLTKQFSQGFFSSQKNMVLNDVSIRIEPGETVGLVGESGSGKSTLALSIARLLNVDSGHIFFDGDEITHLNTSEMRPLRKELQFVFQYPYSSLNPRMLVKDIIREPLNINTNLSDTEKNEKVDWLLNKVGLSIEQSNMSPH